MDCSKPSAGQVPAHRVGGAQGPLYQRLQQAPPRSNFPSHMVIQNGPGRTAHHQHKTTARNAAGAGLAPVEGRFQCMFRIACLQVGGVQLCRGYSSSPSCRSTHAIPTCCRRWEAARSRDHLQPSLWAKLSLASSAYPVKGNSGRYSAQTHPQIAPEGQLDE